MKMDTEGSYGQWRPGSYGVGLSTRCPLHLAPTLEWTRSESNGQAVLTDFSSGEEECSHLVCKDEQYGDSGGLFPIWLVVDSKAGDFYFGHFFLKVYFIAPVSDEIFSWFTKSPCLCPGSQQVLTI